MIMYVGGSVEADKRVVKWARICECEDTQSVLDVRHEYAHIGAMYHDNKLRSFNSYYARELLASKHLAPPIEAYLSHTYGMSGRKFSRMSTRRKRVWFKEKSRLRRLASGKV